MTDLAALRDETLAAIAASQDESALEAARVAALGKKGAISALLASLGKISPDERKSAGAAINALKDEVSDALAAGAAMNEFVRADPYPGFGPFETNLPNLGRYVLDPKESLMYNSGLTAARPEHAPLIEDAIVLIDRLWSAGLKRHDLDQFAVSECFRLGGVPLREINREFEHYFPRWSKRYMRRRLRERSAGEKIAFSKTRVRLFKGMWNLRLGLRKWRRS